MAEFPPSEHLKDLITAHVTLSGWQVDISAMPDDPDRAVAISDTGGVEANPKYLLDFPTCQIMVRGEVNGYLDTYREAKAIKDLLLGIDSQDINGDRLVSVTMNGDLGFIGRDETMRPLFSMNFALITEPQVVGNSNRLPL